MEVLEGLCDAADAELGSGVIKAPPEDGGEESDSFRSLTDPFIRAQTRLASQGLAGGGL